MSNRILQEERERNLKLIKEERGLWDNIHAKRKRGESPAEKGDEDYPEKDSWKKAQKEGSAEDLQSKIASDMGLPKTNRMNDKEAKSMQSKIASDMGLPTSDNSARELRNKIALDMNLDGEEKRKIAEENLNEGSYDQNWVSALESAFNATVKVDKEKGLKPLYGGGSYNMIGYEASLNEPQGEVQGFILEGLQINGKFAEASVIIKINGQWMIHAGLGVDFNPRDDFQNNVNKVMSALEKKISDSTNKSMNEETDSPQDISHFVKISNAEDLERKISNGVVGTNWEWIGETSQEAVIFARITKREDELNMTADEYEEENYEDFYDNEHNGAGQWAFKQKLREVYDAGDEWGLKIIITSTLDV